MSKISQMTSEEQLKLVSDLDALLKEHKIPTRVKIERETVCPIQADSIEDNFNVKVEAKLPPTDEMKARIEAFNTASQKFKDDGVKIAVACQLGEGCKYETITEVEKIDAVGTKCSLEHKEGEVWFVDFWATWCPPCQAPMAHNQKMLEDHGSEWGDKVKIIGLSIDQDVEKLKSHVEAKGWGKVEHYWRSGSSASTQYGVSGVPNVMMIDTKGNIVFKGHPASRKDLVSDFNLLLKGELPEGCVKPAGDSAAEPEMPAAEGKDIDLQKVFEQVDSFKNDKAPTLQKDMKEAVKDFQRAFCVMVTAATFVDGSFKVDFKNYRVLVGPGEAVDKVNDKIKELLPEGDFEVVERVHKL